MRNQFQSHDDKSIWDEMGCQVDMTPNKILEDCKREMEHNLQVGREMGRFVSEIRYRHDGLRNAHDKLKYDPHFINYLHPELCS